jgi:hypothetical protein
MPVFTRCQDGVLVLTVDGDFTPNELRRVAFGAFESSETPREVPVLLDMSGAAGIAGKSAQEMQAMGAIFGAYRDRLRGLSVVVSVEVEERFAENEVFAREAGVSMRAWHSHADARQWLKERLT